MRLSSPLRRFLILALLFLAAAASTGAWWQAGQPVAMADGAPGRLDCASYAPPRLDAAAGSARVATRAEIEAQLRIVAQRFRCIRTYSTVGIDDVPAAARTAGLRLLLGAWISGDNRANRLEIERVIAMANRHRDVIDMVVVGNEVFLRKELPVERLRALLVEVRDRTGLPVTTADIWAFWPQDPALLAVVSTVMIHILPYWDDEPVSIDTALPHVVQVYDAMVRRFPGKAVMIGETGWPTAGRPRGALLPGRVNAARYVRGFTAFAAARGIRYNLIEASDQPWKRPNEGTVGGYWGLYDADGAAKFPLQGPVVENPRWRIAIGLALAAGVLLPLLGRLFRHQLTLAGAAAMGLAGIASGGMAFAQGEYLVAGNRDWLDWCATLAWAGAGWTVAGLALVAVARWLDDGAARPSATEAGARYVRDRVLVMARLGVLLGTAYVSLGLVLAGRHRDFPLAILLVPVVAVVLLDVARRPRERTRPGAEATLLAAWLALAAPLLVWLEGWRNSSALAFGLLSLVLAWTALRPLLTPGDEQGAGEDSYA